MAKSKKDSEVLVLDAEEIIEIPVAEQLSKAIDKEIAHFDPFEKRMNELKKEYAGLDIKGIDDRDGYEDVRKAIGELRTIRTSTDKERKARKSPFLKACKTIEEKAKFIIDGVSAIEEPLQDKKDAIDAQKEAIKAERLAREAERLKLRTAELTKIGVVFNGADYVIEDVQFTLAEVREMDDDLFLEHIYSKFKKVFDSKEAIRIAEENRVKAEKAEQARLEEELRQRQEKLKQQQEELEAAEREVARKQREAAEKAQREERERIDQTIKGRCNQLQALGMKFNFQHDAYVFEDVNVDNKTEICLLPEKEWDELVAKITPFIELRKQAAEEKQKQQQEEEKKAAIAKALAEEKERQERQRIAAEEEQRLAKLRQQEELDKASDKVKFAAVIEQIKAINLPELSTRYWKDKIRVIKEKFEEIQDL